jgi:hypothetical protein
MKVTRGWKKKHNEKFNNLYSSQVQLEEVYKSAISGQSYQDSKLLKMKISGSFETSEYINPARHSTTQDDQNPHPTMAAGCIFSAIFLYTKA